MTEISKFFAALSERAYKENDLSDVTYAMCEADPNFKQFFLDFFFDGQNINAKDCTICREVAYPDGARPDVVVRDKNGQVYFVEVKIWDGSHHFAQYKNTLCDQEKVDQNEVGNHFGYIANYAILKDQLSGADQEVYEVMKSRVKTWGEFAKALKRSCVFEEFMVKAYVEYLVRVCPCDEFELKADWKIKKVDFERVRAVYLGIEDAIKKQNLPLYWRSSRYFVSGYRMGCFFEIPQYQNERSVWAWFGVYYTNEGGVPCVEFEDRDAWGGLVCEKFRKAYGEAIRQQFSFRIYAERDKVRHLDKVGKFDPDGFLRAVLKSIKDGALEDGLTTEVEANKHYVIKGLQAMKCLPMAIERHFFSNDDFLKNLRTLKYELVHGEGGDAEIPHSHCGRYFELRSKDENGNIINTIRGWLGVIYVNDEKRLPQGAKFVVEIDRAEVVRRLGSKRDEWQDDAWGWASSYWDDGVAEKVIKGAAEKVLSFIKNNVNEAQNDRTSL